MIRILHTADWQIGLRASHVARVGSAVRAARFDAARALVARANEERVDSLVLAGDIFEDNHVEDALVREVVRILSSAQVPVHVLPGNHDPLSQDSVYRRTSWAERPSHIHLLETTQPVSIAHGRGLLLPAPLSLKKSEEDPTHSLRAPENGASGAWIGVAHGSLKIEGKHGRDDFPIALDAAARKGLRYSALGHWHGRYVHGDRTAYSGTLETTKFGESGSGLALIVSVDESASASAAPRIEEVRCGQLDWKTREIALSPGSDLELAELERELRAVPDDEAKRTLLRLRTTGECDPAAHQRLKALEDELGPRLLYVETDRRDLPSHIVRGKMAEFVSQHPFVAALFESLEPGSDDPDLGALSGPLSPEERASAQRLLTELMMTNGGGRVGHA
jgi:DNA repair exonuclease SbcCD nuclease subunit